MQDKPSGVAWIFFGVWANAAHLLNINVFGMYPPQWYCGFGSNLWILNFEHVMSGEPSMCKWNCFHSCSLFAQDFFPIRNPSISTFEKGPPVFDNLEKGCWKHQFLKDWTNPCNKGMMNGGLAKHWPQIRPAGCGRRIGNTLQKVITKTRLARNLARGQLPT